MTRLLSLLARLLVALLGLRRHPTTAAEVEALRRGVARVGRC